MHGYVRFVLCPGAQMTNMTVGKLRSAPLLYPHFQFYFDLLDELRLVKCT